MNCRNSMNALYFKQLICFTNYVHSSANQDELGFKKQHILTNLLLKASININQQ